MPKNDSLDPDHEKVAELYNSELRKVLDKHAPELCRAITLGPHAPWYTAELRGLKREKRRWERVYRSLVWRNTDKYTTNSVGNIRH